MVYRRTAIRPNSALAYGGRYAGSGGGPVIRAPGRDRRYTRDIAKPLTGLGSGVMELAVKHRGDAFRVVYALQIGTDIWVIHAFQKKSKSGTTTPKREIDLVHMRLRQLRERLR